MSKKTGKWLPWNLNNGPHECQKKQEDTTKVNGAIKQIEKENQRTTLTVDEIVRRLKSIGINVDWDVFLKGTDPK
jgi:hypothetical protein